MTFSFFFFYCSGDLRYLHSFPTRRSSDLNRLFGAALQRRGLHTIDALPAFLQSRSARPLYGTVERNRKSTRLNSSHANISYAVFCLKKKKKKKKKRTKKKKNY